MGTKSFFNKQKSQEVKIRGQEKSTIDDVKQNVESVDYIKEYSIDKLDFVPQLDFEDPATPQPADYTLTTQSTQAIYGSAVYGTGVYGSDGFPIIRQSIEGSGFTAVVKIDDISSNPPITLKGFQLEFTPGTRM